LHFDAFGGLLMGARRAGGVVDKDLQWTCPARRQSADVILPAQVGKLIMHSGIFSRIDDFLDRLFGLILIAAYQHYLGIQGCSQLPGNGFTNGASRAGDQKGSRVAIRCL
jgi:hypothetical protein